MDFAQLHWIPISRQVSLDFAHLLDFVDLMDLVNSNFRRNDLTKMFTFGNFALRAKENDDIFPSVQLPVSNVTSLRSSTVDTLTSLRDGCM